MIKLFILLVLSINFNVLANAEESVYGFYSGSFDPPTLTHKQIVMYAIKHYKLKKMIIMVSKFSDEKNHKTSTAERVEMLKLMFKDYHNIIIIPQKSFMKKHDMSLIRELINEPIIHITGVDNYPKLVNIPPHDRVNFDKVSVIKPLKCKSNTQEFIKLQGNAEYLPLLDGFNYVCTVNVRMQLLKGDFENLPLDKEVLNYIKNNKLYIEPSKDKYASLNREYEEAFKLFQQKILNSIKELNDKSPPIFNAAESKASWSEKFEKWFYKSQANVLKSH